MSEDPLEDDEVSPNPQSSPAKTIQDPPQPVKRKGGRKPVYTTVQERKQRNRMAQAAFRERRTEYIKQLEDALKENEGQIQHLRRSNRESVEECHMLRYKMSLLEDLLYENGVDYQSELQSRSTRSLLNSQYPTQQGNKQGSAEQGSSGIEQIGSHGGSTTMSLLRPIKGKPKASSIHNPNVHTNQPFEGHLEPRASRAAPGLTPLDSPGILSANFDYSNGGSSSVHSAFQSARFQFEDTRIDPAISTDEAEPYYAMAPQTMGMHLDSEHGSRTSSLDENAMPGFQNGHERQDLVGYHRDAPVVRSSQNSPIPNYLAHRLRMQQHRPSYDHSLFGQPATTDLGILVAPNQASLPDDFALDTDSLN